MNNTMKALVATAPGKYELENRPIPQIGEEDILIKVEACGICAGDIKASHGTDTIVHDMAWEMGRLLSLDVPDAWLEAILVKNMDEILQKKI